MPKLTALVIAPEVAGLPPLAQAAELTRIGDDPNIDVPAPLIGREVTQDRIINRLSVRRFDAVLWAGHGLPGRLALSDGNFVDPRWLASQLRRAGVELLILSVCQSAQRPEASSLALGFSDVIPASGVSLIAMTVDVSDRVAVEYDVALIKALANGDSLRRAHEVGLEVISQHGSIVQSPQLFMADESIGKPRERQRDPVETKVSPMIEARLVNTEAAIRSLDTKMDKLSDQIHSLDTRQQMLEIKVQGVIEKLADVEKEVRAVRSGHVAEPPSRFVVAAAAIVMLTVLVLTIIITWRLL